MTPQRRVLASSRPCPQGPWVSPEALVLLLVVAVLGRASNAHACAGCSNPNLPNARTTNASLGAGTALTALNLTLTTMRVVHAETCPDIGPICRERDEPPQQHDQRFWVAELRPIVTVGLSSVFGLEAHLPLRLLRTTIQFRRLDGTPFSPDYENIHHRNETLVGLADPWLLGVATGTLGIVRISSRAGVGLPVGRTEEDPFARARAGLSHQHIQFGTGTFFPVVAVDVGLPLGPARLNAYGQGTFFLYENSRGYLAGNRYSVGLSGDMELVHSGLRLGAAVDALHEQPERWGGVVQQDGNVGRTDVLAGGTLSYGVGSVVASLSVKAPVWQHFIETDHRHGSDPGQLTYPAIVNLAVQTAWGGRER